MKTPLVAPLAPTKEPKVKRYPAVTKALADYVWTKLGVNLPIKGKK